MFGQYEIRSNTTLKRSGLMVTLKKSQIALKYCLTTELAIS